jgi:hypothetical protein
MKSITLPFILLLLVSFSFLKADSQIIYTDIYPDDTIACSSATLYCSDSLIVDLNTDGIIDFTIQMYRSRTNYGSGMCMYYSLTSNYSVSPEGLNAIAGDTVGPIVLPFASMIDSSLQWRDSSTLPIRNSLSYSWMRSIKHCPPPVVPGASLTAGYWRNQFDQYLGVKILSSGFSNYGWIRISADSSGLMIVKDFAYNSAYGQYILAGDTGSGISGISNKLTLNSVYSIYPNPASEYVTVNSYFDNANCECTIFDNLGRVVKRVILDPQKNSKIDLSAIANGIYSINMSNNNVVLFKSKLTILK